MRIQRLAESREVLRRGETSGFVAADGELVAPVRHTSTAPVWELA
ncbi:MAG: hypothetical protein ACE5H5_00800 [Nitrospinota bacterium]